LKVCIIYDKFYEYDGSRVTIGGIQSYISSLSKVIIKNKMDLIIYQRARKDFVAIHNEVKVKGICEKYGELPSFRQLAMKAKNNEGLTHSDLIIWATEDISYRVDFCKTLSIQHGISFDVYRSDSKLIKLFKKYLNLDIVTLYQLLRYRKALKEISNTTNVVCVDYNYQNWYRTIFPNRPLNFYVIPNFTKIQKKEKIDNKISNWKNESRTIKLLFARRFFDIRGVSIMIELSERLIERYGSKIEITFAGEGPKMNEVLQLSNKYPNIFITTYEPENSIDFHSIYDIALIPSTGSEGTSLSLLEAMSAGCYCVASQVGGLTNIIIDGFNGMLLRANVDDWFTGVSNLIDNTESNEITRQVINGYNVVSNSFSLERWEYAWEDILNKMKENDS
jgi:glycosyltransferase involved in cell wall biosynthesis